MKNLVIFAFLTLSFLAIGQEVAPAKKNWFEEVSVIVGALVLAFEYFLGKTSLVKSNSTIDLVLSFVKGIFGKKA